MTKFSILLQTCGLSQREAAEYLGTRLDTVKSWSSGRNRTPPGVVSELATLAALIDNAAQRWLAQIDQLKVVNGAPEIIELGLASDDAEAQSIGWPCVGAQAASVGRLIAAGMQRGYQFDIVPRGSAIDSAGASDDTPKIAMSIILSPPHGGLN